MIHPFHIRYKYGDSCTMKEKKKIKRGGAGTTADKKKKNQVGYSS